MDEKKKDSPQLDSSLSQTSSPGGLDFIWPPPDVRIVGQLMLLCKDIKTVRTVTLSFKNISISMSYYKPIFR